jgi:hypothetical protein
MGPGHSLVAQLGCLGMPVRCGTCWPLRCPDVRAFGRGGGRRDGFLKKGRLVRHRGQHDRPGTQNGLMWMVS